MDKVMMDKIMACKSPKELKNFLNLDDNKRQELTLNDLENVSGGGHFIKDSAGTNIWIELMDKGYVCGTDNLNDFAFMFEKMASDGCSVEFLVSISQNMFGGGRADIKAALLNGGPAYLAKYYRRQFEGID